MIIQATHEQTDQAFMDAIRPFIIEVVAPKFERWLLYGDSDFEGEPAGIRSLSESEMADD